MQVYVIHWSFYLTTLYPFFPQGTTYVYDSFFRPYVAKHENEIDRNLVELRTRAGDMAVIYCRKAVCYGQTRVTDILQFVALQSTPKPQPKVIYAPTKKPYEATIGFCLYNGDDIFEFPLILIFDI